MTDDAFRQEIIDRMKGLSYGLILACMASWFVVGLMLRPNDCKCTSPAPQPTAARLVQVETPPDTGVTP